YGFIPRPVWLNLKASKISLYDVPRDRAFFPFLPVVWEDARIMVVITILFLIFCIAVASANFCVFI
ncbi:hypothetical protein R0K19_21060, partial [Bacillus sp. SIMBA_161]